MAERIVEANGVELCTEAFGDPADPPVLLLMGVGASMLWWPDEFCRMLAGGGRFVIRYDHRDTGQSVAYEPGNPGYTGDDLVADAAGILDAHGIPAAHVVGLSMGGALAQLLALDHPDRILSLVLMSTTFAGPSERELPPVTEEYASFSATAEVDWSDPESVIAYVVEDSRALAGNKAEFDEAGAHARATRDVERARNFASVQNHGLLSGGERDQVPSLVIPTLVIHGSADPLFPLGHGKALADEISGATLVVLEGAGHELRQADWDTIVRAILGHTEGGNER